MSEKFFEFLEEKLRRLKEQNLYRSLKDVNSRDGMEITINGKKIYKFLIQ